DKNEYNKIELKKRLNLKKNYYKNYLFVTIDKNNNVDTAVFYGKKRLNKENNLIYYGKFRYDFSISLVTKNKLEIKTPINFMGLYKLKHVYIKVSSKATSK
ncbi:MAG: hypothetical protein V4622_09685, partial [Bacteroidota bacterium]